MSDCSSSSAGWSMPVRSSRARTLSSQQLEHVRLIVLESIEEGSAMLTLDELADRAQIPRRPLRDRFGRPERLVDEVVASVLRRARPIVGAGDPDVVDVISDLVNRRLVVSEQIEPVWPLIGQGESSTLEFDALRSALQADVDWRLQTRVADLAPKRRIEAVRIVDGALRLDAVRSLGGPADTAVREARLIGQLETLFELYDLRLDPVDADQTARGSGHVPD